MHVSESVEVERVLEIVFQKRKLVSEIKKQMEIISF